MPSHQQQLPYITSGICTPNPSVTQSRLQTSVTLKIFHPNFTSHLNETPRLGLEPRTLRLTAGCSTIELSRNSPLPESYARSISQARESPFGWSRTTATDVRSISFRSAGKGKSTREVLPLLTPCYQHGASLFGLWWVVEDGGIEPLQLPVLWFSRPVAVHSAASSAGCLTGLEPARTGFTNQRLDRLDFRHHQWIWRGSNPQPLLCKRSVLPLELQTRIQ